jgi:hypothetical protein
MKPRLQRLLTLLALLVALPGWAQQERALTDKQKTELAESVEEILQFIEKGTGLKPKQPIERAFVDRAGLRAHIEKNSSEEDAARVRRSELVLKRFGLLPRDFDLRKFSVELGVDRIAGYYDTKKKVVYLLDFKPVVQQKPILAHELTHALQDQHYGITEWAKAIAEEKPEMPDDGLTAVLAAEESAFARRAVVEGQANVVLVEYALQAAREWAGPWALRGQSMWRAPVLMSLVEPGSESPLYKSAPVALKESMAFPYTFGYGFVRALLDKRGATLAYEEVMRKPPSTSRHIMFPATYLREEELPEVRLPDLREALDGKYRRLNAGTMGAFDVYVLGKHFDGEGMADKLAKRWRGGVHYAAVPAGLKDEELQPGQVWLLYLSRWDSEKSARDFAKQYGKWMRNRYEQLTATGEAQWETEDGPVSIEVRGDDVLVMEGFAPEIASRVRSAVWQGITPP